MPKSKRKPHKESAWAVLLMWNDNVEFYEDVIGMPMLFSYKDVAKYEASEIMKHRHYMPKRVVVVQVDIIERQRRK